LRRNLVVRETSGRENGDLLAAGNAEDGTDGQTSR